MKIFAREVLEIRQRINSSFMVICEIHMEELGIALTVKEFISFES
jgi:hypothetical protein